MYVRGALLLAADLPQPWSLWLAVDNATMLAWGEMLSSAANIHLVVVRRQQEQQDTKRRRRAEGWAVNMFTRYLLLDDASLVLTSPFMCEHVVEWVTNTGRHAQMLS